ncbi:hypothetical protein BTM25_22320 [Actinomadura rubteroloni]|uniref:Double-GTPase 2 domain-containing protein n=1 Tax=Actinomadura rubteroloni TaxID=1926885 RepID=A0A2P4URY6_9ACTN|nr:hypothetical protein [Actinomadura rubteroloni]POM27810.1 hypothetical protein BTM25_22320 [Actinomadura rubteroloni]
MTAPPRQPGPYGEPNHFGPPPQQYGRTQRYEQQYGQPAPGRAVICPYCLNTIDWQDFGTVPLVRETTEGPEALTRALGESDERWRHRTLGAKRQCRGDGEPHYLPADYGELEPLIIGIVGASAAGKTHLLTSMIAQLERRRAMLSGELTFRPLDGRLRQRFYEDRVRPFLEHRRVLPRTGRTERAEFVYGLRVTSAHTGRSHAVVFFDVAGELFDAHEYEATPFMSLVDGLIYVADGSRLRSGDRWNPWPPEPGFAAAIAQLTDAPARGPVPAVIVVAKSDVLDGVDDDETVTRWIGRQDETRLADLRTAKLESREAFHFLRRRGAELWLEPFQPGSPVTLHFASASGVPQLPDPELGAFPDDGFGPKRVLRPLLSLFSMAGLVPAIEMEEPPGPPPPPLYY